MYRASRHKRDSATNLYRTCQISGNCLPDVKNKIEGDTLADRLLKWFGSFIYLGNLGIGTGRGTGGTFGYRPIAPATTRPAPGVTTRPNVLVEPLGPTDILPVDIGLVDPSAPSIIPLNEGTIPDISNIDIVDPAIGASEVDVVTEINNRPPIDIDVHPNVTIVDEAAILDIQNIGPPPKRIALETITDTSTVTVHSTVAHPDPDINVFVDTHFDGDIVGNYEEIPLEPLPKRAKFDILEPSTSTPKEYFYKGISKTKDLYNRFVHQVPTQNPNFLGQASRAVQFEITNPAFDPDVSLIFERDVEALAAPDPDFADIRALGKQRLSETADRNVRVSRLAQKGTIHTRSGIQIGPKVHFYMDLSPISGSEEFIELRDLGSFTGESSTVNSNAESTFIYSLDPGNIFAEDELLDPPISAFENSQLVFNTLEDTEPVFYFEPLRRPSVIIPQFITNSTAIYVSYPAENNFTPLLNILPSDFGISYDFDLHPSLRKRKKRKHLAMF